MSDTNKIDFQNKDITDLILPGLYEILDKKNQKSYYGETDSLAKRYSDHLRELNNETHSNLSLQKAYTEIKKESRIDNFRFIILEIGPEWKDKKKRLKKEQEYIELNRKRAYNAIEEKVFKKTIRPIMANGKKYPSVHKASKDENIPRSTLMRYLNDPKNSDFYYLIDQENSDYCMIPIFGKKENGPSIFFESYTECIKAGFASNHQNIRRKIKKKEPGWYFAHTDEKGNPLRIPYSLKPGEIAYKDWIQDQ